MSIFFGYGAGVKIGNSIRELLFANHGMIIAHRIPGRRRYTCIALKGNAEACSELEKNLQTFPGITSARVSAVTGSVTITYTQSEKVINALFDALSHKIAGKHAVQEETIIPTGVITVGDNINDTLQKAKKGITRFINHTEPAFLTRMAGIALLCYGLNRIISNGDRPAGPQLALWGLALLIRRSHPEPKMLTDDTEQIL
ncbi:MAG: heavy-metal-associated domain-containing protein [Succinivibrio sp.]|nr:heavy-metal-associated domain-containing protein [Succinivibrio sp.]